MMNIHFDQVIGIKWEGNVALPSSAVIWTTSQVAYEALQLSHASARPPVRWGDLDVLPLLLDERKLITVTHNEATNYFRTLDQSTSFMKHALGSNHYVIVINPSENNDILTSVKCLSGLAGLPVSKAHKLLSALRRGNDLFNIGGLALEAVPLSPELQMCHLFMAHATWTILINPSVEDASQLFPLLYRQSAGTAFFVMYSGPSTPRGAPIFTNGQFDINMLMSTLQDSRKHALPDIIVVLACANALKQASDVESSMGNGRDPKWVLRNNLNNVFGVTHPSAKSWHTILSGDDSSFHQVVASKSAPSSEFDQTFSQCEADTTRALALLFIQYYRAAWHITWQRPKSKTKHMPSDGCRQRLPLFCWPLGVGKVNPLEVLADVVRDREASS